MYAQQILGKDKNKNFDFLHSIKGRTKFVKQYEEKIAVIIPARMDSTRFYGKPLALINGTEMIVGVANRCMEAVGKRNTYVATDSVEIQKVCEKNGINVVLTGPSLTGTDRTYQANKIINADIIINVQGDEPLVAPNDIRKCLQEKINNRDCVINFYSKASKEDLDNPSTPKVVVSDDNHLIYCSRAKIPSNKENKESNYDNFKKQVCIYAFTREELEEFYDKEKKGNIEEEEDIEILRFLENNKSVKMLETKNVYQAVDCLSDIKIVESLLKKHDKEL